ncbi:MAG: RsmB/NOP family class I SAM-dependent RNA methyltransferase [Treponema sp.]|nr:RsmB/NOP family class I SAM-dependent RNA methyltransferase [Treponema sp.]
MKKEKNRLYGKSGFEEYYSQIFNERWIKLKEAFLSEKENVELKIKACESYFLDSASIIPALCLPLKNAEKILDLCAAPGGKTLVLASRMNASATLFSNERSLERKKRLLNVVNTCLPPEINERVEVSCSDGAVWCTRESECYDSILLDAPCSSERHVYLDPKYLNEWTPSRIKTVAMEQWALLSCAYRLLKPDGFLVYSTCALSPVENDLMMEKLIKKYNKTGNDFEFLEPAPDYSELKEFVKFNPPDFEKTNYGYQIFPDVQNGAGPIYFSIIRKNKSFFS